CAPPCRIGDADDSREEAELLRSCRRPAYHAHASLLADDFGDLSERNPLLGDAVVFAPAVPFSRSRRRLGLGGSSPAPPDPDEASREHRLHDDRAEDASADSSSQELEKPETREQRERSPRDQTHRRADIRGGSRSSEEEHEGEAEIDCANPASYDKRAGGRLDAPLIENGTTGEDEAEAEKAAGN